MVDDGNASGEYLPSNPEHIQFHLIEAIVAELQGQRRSPSHGDSAARTSWVMDSKLAIVNWPFATQREVVRS